MSEASEWKAVYWSRNAATTLVVEESAAPLGRRVIAEFEDEADARLAQAAPQLQAALAGLLADVCSEFGNRVPLYLHPRIVEAQAALQRARRCFDHGLVLGGNKWTRADQEIARERIPLQSQAIYATQDYCDYSRTCARMRSRGCVAAARTAIYLEGCT